MDDAPMDHQHADLEARLTILEQDIRAHIGHTEFRPLEGPLGPNTVTTGEHALDLLCDLYLDVIAGKPVDAQIQAWMEARPFLLHRASHGR
jgi:hypothetical protein